MGQYNTLNLETNHNRFFYGWWIVMIGVVLLTINSLAVFRGIGVLVIVLRKELGWNRTQVTIGTFLSRAEGAALGPIEGYLIDKIGARKMVLIGMSIMGVGFLMFSRIQNVWQFYAVYIVITLGAGMGGWLAVASLINNWFIRKKSIAMAIAMSGIYIAGFLLTPYGKAMYIDFRLTLLVIGLIVLVVTFPSVFIIRNKPELMGLLPDGNRGCRNKKTLSDNPNTLPDLAMGTNPIDFTVSQALKLPVFWILTLAHVCSTISIATMGVHLTPRITDLLVSLGRSEESALTLATNVEFVYSAFALPAIFISGSLGDRFSKQKMLVFFLILQSISTLILALGNTLSMAFVFAVIYGIAFGGRVPLMSAIRGDYFGRKNFASITGWSMLPNGILMAIVPVTIAWWYDNYHTYTLPFLVLAMINFVGAVVMIFANPPRYHLNANKPNIKKNIETNEIN